MNRRALTVMWLVVGVLVWNGFFDLYISRGAREYLQMAAEAELGRGDVPSMAHVMSDSKRRGAVAASGWALLVTGAGLMTTFLTAPRRR